MGVYVADFETTVYEGQTHTEVWAASMVEIDTENVQIFHSIGEWWRNVTLLGENSTIYFHNLKFDGEFILSFLLKNLHYKQAFEQTDENGSGYFLKNKEMKSKTLKYVISELGQWYSIIVKVNGIFITIQDSLKLLPFSVSEIGKAFKTKHQKLEMEYTGHRYAGCEITEEEQAYIKNDVLVVKEALEQMFKEGHKKMTIGSCCLAEYKRLLKETSAYDWGELFPDVYQMEVPGIGNAGKWIAKGYRGGWCYVVPGAEGNVYHDGVTADVNSLYPSMMHSESGNYYPIGRPYFWLGKQIPKQALMPERFYYIKVRTRFYLKSGKLPFIQLKGNLLYRGTESLTTSDVWDPKTKRYYREWRAPNGEVHQAIPELTLTMMDWELLKEQYRLEDTEILGGCWFYAMKGLFDVYIDKYKKIKMESKGAKRTLSKLFLNNLYGKLAASPDSSFKVAYEENGIIRYYPVSAAEKKPGYIPAGAAITSYARCFTIRAAQANYYGPGKRGFKYADTDSIHCDLSPDQLRGIKVDPVAFCCWKLESYWDKAVFARQKTYIEHVTHEDGDPCDPYYNIKCAGMPNRCKDLLIRSIRKDIPGRTERRKLSPEQLRFLFLPDGTFQHRKLTDFKTGLEIPGKLVPRRIPGGIVLTDSTYQMR